MFKALCKTTKLNIQRLPSKEFDMPLERR